MVKDLKNSFKTSAGGHAVKQTFQILQFQLHVHCFVRLVSLDQSLAGWWISSFVFGN